MVTLGGGLLAVESLPRGIRTSSPAFVFLSAFGFVFCKFARNIFSKVKYEHYSRGDFSILCCFSVCVWISVKFWRKKTLNKLLLKEKYQHLILLCVSISYNYHTNCISWWLSGWNSQLRQNDCSVLPNCIFILYNLYVYKLYNWTV